MYPDIAPGEIPQKQLDLATSRISWPFWNKAESPLKLPPETKACIFDFDGTVADTAQVRRAALNTLLNRVLTAWGMRLEQSELALVSASLSQSFYDSCLLAAKVIYTSAQNQRSEIVERFDSSEALAGELRKIRKLAFEEALAGIGAEFLIVANSDKFALSLKARGMRLAICSGSPGHMINGVLDKVKLRDCFEVVVCSDDHETRGRNRKPSPTPYLCCLNRLGVSSAETVAFEDSLIGALSAARAGITTYVRTASDFRHLKSPASVNLKLRAELSDLKARFHFLGAESAWCQ